MLRPGLYPIVDVDLLRQRGHSPLAAAAATLAARPALLQLRAKSSGSRETLELLRALRPPCAQAGTLFFANDRPDLAELAGCDGVHLGQSDLPAREVRALFPRLKVGVSTHSLPELEEALDFAPDYVAFGPVFATATKENPDPVVGLEGLARAAELARRANVPLVAIGGIDLDRAPAVARLGAIGAVISALSPSGASPAELCERALRLNEALARVS